MPGGGVQVVDRVVGDGEPVLGGIELHRVADPGGGERVVEQLGLFGREGLVVLRARHIDRGGDVPGRQVRAGRVVGDGEPTAVERRGGRSPSPFAAAAGQPPESCAWPMAASSKSTRSANRASGSPKDHPARLPLLSTWPR